MYNSAMTTLTTTIRVPGDTRDILAAEAARSKRSLAQFLSDQAAEIRRAEWFRQARQASLADSRDSLAMAEQAEWENDDDDID